MLNTRISIKRNHFKTGTQPLAVKHTTKHTTCCKHVKIFERTRKVQQRNPYWPTKKNSIKLAVYRLQCFVYITEISMYKLSFASGSHNCTRKERSRPCMIHYNTTLKKKDTTTWCLCVFFFFSLNLFNVYSRGSYQRR